MTDNAKFPPSHYIGLDDDALVAQCSVDHFRSSGPGGQKRNKTSSAVRVRHRPTGIAASAADDRAQSVNKLRALRRLRWAIALSIRTPINVESYTPSPLLQTCITGEGRFTVGRRDVRYPVAVSEILDILAAHEMRLQPSAEQFGVTTAHLAKFIQSEPKLWQHVNQLRQQAGIKPLR